MGGNFTCVLLFVVCGVAGLLQAKTDHFLKPQSSSDSENWEDALNQVRKLYSNVKKQNAIINEQNMQIELQNKRIESQDREIQKQAETISNQAEIIENFKAALDHQTKVSSGTEVKMEQCSVKLEDISATIKTEHSTVKGNATVYQKTVYGCLYDVLEMSCQDGGMLFITNATYGRYYDECSNCCPPDPERDCINDFKTVVPEEWINVRLVCNYQSQCSYQFQSNQLISCTDQVLANYMTITYLCTNEQSVEPIAFTAYESSNFENYYEGDVVQFDTAITNLGNYFLTYNGSFICPYDGLYVFSVNVVGYQTYRMVARIMREDDLLVTAFADDLDDDAGLMDNQASNLVVTECFSGEMVWIESFENGRLRSTGNRYCTFSGFLLYRYIS